VSPSATPEELAALARERRLREQIDQIRKAALEMDEHVEAGPVLQSIADHARAIAGATASAIGLAAEVGAVLDPWTFSGLPESEAQQIGRVPRLVGLLAAVAAERKPIRVHDLTKDARFGGFPPGHPVLQSLLAVPLLNRGSSQGTLFVANRAGEADFSDDDQRALELFAQHASVALERARIHGEMLRELALRRQIERVLRDSEHRFRALFNETFQFVALLTVEGLVLECNRAALDFGGVREDDVLGRAFWEARWWSHSPAVQERLRRAIAEAARGNFVRYEAEVRGKDGFAIIDFSLKPVRDERGHVVLLIPEGRDISDRKRAEEERARLLISEQTALAEARSARARLEAIFESAAVGVVFVEGETQRRLVNPAAKRILGEDFEGRFDPSMLAGRVTRPDGTPMDVSDLPIVRVLHGESVPPTEMVFKRLDGTTVPIEVIAASAHDSGGHVGGAVVTFTDISTRKELEQLRKEWISIVAHDLRQPVNTISLYAQILVRQKEVAEDAGHILASARRLSRMITDLLDLNSLDASRLQLSPQPVNLPTLVRAVTDRVAADTEGHPVEIAQEGEIPEILVDPARFEQMLGNLLSNAAKYGEPGTPIRVELRVRETEVHLAVQNHGAGIPPEELPRLFTRYHRTRHAKAKGTPGLGLGLYITRGLVEAHGGWIKAESIPNDVTTFRVGLPLKKTG
jgi:PAS domain S-box-containing protein